MIKHHVLIDFENIQPSADDLSCFNDEGVKITVFANAKQNLSVYTDQISQQFGGRVGEIIMSDSGKNALDFFIAFRVGFILRDNPKDKVSVLSNDTGFDPLIKYLATTFLSPIERLGLEDIKSLRERFAPPKGFAEASVTPGTLKQRVTRICAALQTLQTKPYNTILVFTDFIKEILSDCDLSEPQIAGLLKFMVQKEIISVNGNDPERFLYHSGNISAAVNGVFITKEPIKISQTNTEPASPVKEWMEKICDDLEKRGTSRPKTLKTLTGTIKALCKGSLSVQQIETALDFMKKKKIITVSDGTKVTYNLKNFKTA